jgi:hypothetical protein
LPEDYKEGEFLIPGFVIRASINERTIEQDNAARILVERSLRQKLEIIRNPTL